MKHILKTIVLILIYYTGMFSLYRVLNYYTKDIAVIQMMHLDEVITVIITIIISWLFIRENKTYKFRLEQTHRKLEVIAGISWGMIVYVILDIALLLIPQDIFTKTNYNVHNTTEEIMNVEAYQEQAVLSGNIELLFVLMLVMLVIQIAILPPIREELFYRGIVCNQIGMFNIGLGIVLSSVYFGVEHNTLIQEIYAMCIGFVCCLVDLKYKSLRPSIYLHIVVNFMGTCVPIFLAILGLYNNVIAQAGVLTFNLFFGITGIYLIHKYKERGKENDNRDCGKDK